MAETGRRHRSDEERLKIVEEGHLQAQLARRYGILTIQLWDWRARYKAGLLEHRAEFSQVVVIQETLEIVARQWKAIQTVQEKFTCRSCE